EDDVGEDEQKRCPAVPAMPDGQAVEAREALEPRQPREQQNLDQREVGTEQPCDSAEAREEVARGVHRGDAAAVDPQTDDRACVRGHDAADRGADQDPPRARAGGGARGGKGGGPDREVGHRRQEDLTPSLTSTVRVLPPRRTVSFTVSPGLCASISARSCWDVVTFVPLNAVITSPPVG